MVRRVGVNLSEAGQRTSVSGVAEREAIRRRAGSPVG